MTPTPDNATKEGLWKEWGYTFKEWMERLQSAPVALIKSVDKSSGYDMDRRHVFKLENGRYALILESGCSCYSSSEAEIEIHPNLSAVKTAWNSRIPVPTADPYSLGHEWQGERWA